MLVGAQPKAPGVYVREKEPSSRPIEGAGTAVAAFIGFAEMGEVNKPTPVTNWTQFRTQFGGFVPGRYLAQSVFGFFSNGGGKCYVVRLPDGDGNGAPPRPEPPRAELGGYQFVGVDGTADGVRVALTDYRTEPPATEEPPSDPVTGVRITITPRTGVDEVIDVPVPSGKSEGQEVRTKLAKHPLVRVETLTATEQPARGVATLTTPPLPVRVTSKAYTGGEDQPRAGLAGLNTIEDVTMVVVPDLMSAYEQGAIDEDAVRTVQEQMVAHCSEMGRMAILDTPPGKGPTEVKAWVQKVGYDSPFATMYWPWIEVGDPSGKGRVCLPPSGHVAGVWSRNDDTRGVHKAPANERVFGVLGLEAQLTRTEQGDLNELGLNCLREFPGMGTKIWGARTLSRKSEWRYVNVRRYFNYLQASILNGTQWVPFEPNDEQLWARIRRSVTAFLTTEWRRGALFGATADQAFFVKCDGENNTDETISLGNVICDIGVAPVKPAEFVIFQLQQLPSGVGVVAE